VTLRPQIVSGVFDPLVADAPLSFSELCPKPVLSSSSNRRFGSCTGAVVQGLRAHMTSPEDLAAVQSAWTGANHPVECSQGGAHRSQEDHGVENSADDDEDIVFHIRIGGGSTGKAISLSYLQKIPLKEDGSRSSYGSRDHPDSCTPCCFVSRVRGCVDGILCNMCHESHTMQTYSQRKKQRIKKAKQSS